MKMDVNALPYVTHGILIWLASAFLVMPCIAAEELPILRLNPVMHSEMINRIAIDKEESPTIVATASDDKTVRLWELPEGRLYRVLRPPISDGNEGKLFAVAVTTDSFMVAAGGWTKAGFRGFGNHNVYLFDASNGEIFNRISGLDNVVLHLAFSHEASFVNSQPAGYLAGTLSGQNGIRVWNLATMTEALRDMDYAGDSYWAEFSPDDQFLVSSSYDGYVRLYEWNHAHSKLHLKTKRRFDEHTQPFAVRFSPDGEKIAVGFSGVNKLAVLNSKDLSLLYWTPSADIGPGDLYTNAWSLDGKILYGGGGLHVGIQQHLVAWSKAGRGATQSWPVAYNTLMALQATEQNQMLYASSEPAWGLIDEKGEKIIERQRETVYFNKLFPHGLLVSEDAQVVQFTHDTLNAQKTLQFSLLDRRLTEIQEKKAEETEEKSQQEVSLSVGEVQDFLIKKEFFAGPADNMMGKQTRKALKAFQKSVELPESGRLDKDTINALVAAIAQPEEEPFKLLPPVSTVPDLELKSWKNSPTPQLNGVALPLGKNDTAMSYAFSPSGKTLVLGSRFRFYHYDKTGKELWRKDAPGIVWALNISANGKILLAAFSDGTLRWYQLQNGRELLALYPHADARRWIAWTPAGLYAASVGADTLLGWHLNNAVDEAADFFPIRSLRNHYYQPEMLTQTLNEINAETEASASSGVNQILNAGENQSEQEVPDHFPPRVLVSSPQDASAFSTEEIELNYRLRFHTEVTPVTLHVMLDGRPWHSLKTETEQGSFTLKLPPRTVELALLAENEYGVSPSEMLLLYWQGQEAEERKPDLYVLSIGISEYANADLGNLPSASADARAFAEKWQAESSYYGNIQVKYLENSHYAEMMEGLSWLRQAQVNDVAMVFLSGHSLQHLDNRKNTYFFLPADANVTSNTVSSTVLLDAFSNFKGKVLMFIDTAYFSMLAKKTEKLSPADIDGFVNELSSPEHGLIILASSVGTQTVQIPQDAEHSLFTSALLDALAGHADSNQDQRIMLRELGQYVAGRVVELSGGAQSPVLAMPDTAKNFILETVAEKPAALANTNAD